MSTHLPPPVGPTWGQWTYRARSVEFDTKRSKLATYIRIHLAEHQVDAPAHDVVAPGLVVIAIILLREGDDALLDAAPLRIGTPADLLGAAADLLDALGAELR